MIDLPRRRFLEGLLASGTLPLLPRFALGAGLPPPRNVYELVVEEQRVVVAGRPTRAITINGSMPGPVLHWQEGETVQLTVRNQLREDTSVHWHGILLPFEMDGVPGVSFEGIPAGESFTYRFDVKQAGTYWYHSHSGLQEQRGMVGPIVVSPREPVGPSVDREHVIVLTDYTFLRPERVMHLLKKSSGFFNFQKRTVVDALTARDGQTMAETLMWGRMRMEPTDIADVTGSTYHFLMNGLDRVRGWFGRANPGERVRLRIVNASAMTHFDLRIPGLPMTVIEADGQPVRPVEVDELRVAVAETYDVVVTMGDEEAYTVFAETMDRSGAAVGFLGPSPDVRAPVPPRRPRPLLTMADMGMMHDDHGAMDHGSMDHGPMDHGSMDHGSMGHAPMDHQAMGHQTTESPSSVPLMLPEEPAPHGPERHGPLAVSVAQQPRVLVDQPGPGLRDAPWRVLVYSDLVAPEPYDALGPVDRQIEMHLTGHMERYAWGFDGKGFREEPYVDLVLGERVRLVFVNDTMMSHPIHLHGMWMYLENGRGELAPRKHTIDVRPAERVSVVVHVDAPGDWAFHCHLQYHMDQGMFRIVRVHDRGTA